MQEVQGCLGGSRAFGACRGPPPPRDFKVVGRGKGEVKPPECPTRHPRVGGYIYRYGCVCIYACIYPCIPAFICTYIMRTYLYVVCIHAYTYICRHLIANDSLTSILEHQPCFGAVRSGPMEYDRRGPYHNHDFCWLVV